MCKPSVLLMTAPKDNWWPAGLPQSLWNKPWADQELASVRGELNYKLLETGLDERLIVKMVELRNEIEVEMRKRKRASEAKMAAAGKREPSRLYSTMPSVAKAHAQGCLFQESKIDYSLNRMS